MRRIALINQKGGVGKTTTTANLGAALAEAGQRVVLIDLDPQANLSLHLGIEIGADEPSTYGLLLGRHDLAAGLRELAPGLRLLPSHLDLSGAEMEIAGAIGREQLLRDAIDAWEATAGDDPADFLLIDCPPSLGLLSVNGLCAADEAFITLQTEFFALQGMSKLVDVVQLLRRRLNPRLRITGILPCLYDPRLRLAREVLGEIRRYFPGQVFQHPIRSTVKLAEAPSYGQTIFQYAPDSNGARDYRLLAAEVLAQTDAKPSDAETPAPADAAAPAVADPPSAAGRPSDDGDDEEEPEVLVLVPGKGLQPATRESDARPAPAERATPRAADLPPLPEDAFDTPAGD